MPNTARSTPTSAPQIRALKARGLPFVTVPDSYYVSLKQRLSRSKITVKEDLDEVGVTRVCVCVRACASS